MPKDLSDDSRLVKVQIILTGSLPLLQCRVNHGQELSGFEALLLHGAAGTGRGTCTAPLAQGVGHLGLALLAFRHDLYGIIGADRLTDPAAGADVFVDTGNGCLGLVDPAVYIL